MQTLSERLQWARAASGLSSRGLARAAGLSQRHIGFLESGERDNPELRTLVAIAKALGVPLGWLAAGEGRRPTAKHIRKTAQAALEAADLGRISAAA